LRRGELFFWLFWNLSLIYVAAKIIGARLFLIYVYGWSRVQDEHLRILSMPKTRAWPVSNGDTIQEGHFIHFLISSVCWIGLFLATYPTARRILPPRDRVAVP
jgi:uncharacterized membrane-anchored protein YitT (DUF2179 family)